MAQYVVYNTTTGDIVGSITGGDYEATHNCPTGCAVMLGTATKNQMVDLAPLAIIDAPVAAITPEELVTFAGNQRDAYWFGSLRVNIGTTDTPIMALVDVSAQGRADILGLIQEFISGALSVPWYQSTGTLDITQSQLMTISSAVQAYVQGALAVWQQSINGINATPPTITDYAQITALPWPPRANP